VLVADVESGPRTESVSERHIAAHLERNRFMRHSVPRVPAPNRTAGVEPDGSGQPLYRNPLRGDPRFHNEPDLARVIARLRAIASQE
jgi:hypothetical protein